MKKVTAFSGGGAKGPIQLPILVKLEKQEGEPLYKSRNIIAGTSVGSIHAAIISTGLISMIRLDTIYQDMLKIVFDRKIGIPLYDIDNIEKAWKKYIPADFRMGDCRTKLMIVMVNSLNDRNVFAKSWKTEWENDRLIDIVMNSCSAPLYFGYRPDYKRKMIFGDGGIGNSNFPLNALKNEVIKFGWLCDEDVLFEAIGCGFYEEEENFDKVIKKKFLKNISQIFDFMKPKDGGLARVQSRYDQIQEMVNLAENRKNISFQYWDYFIPKKYDAMDKLQYFNDYKEFGYKMAIKPLIEVH